MKRSLALIVCGILTVLWMVASRPSEAAVPSSQSSPADDPYVQGDVSSAAWSAQCQPVPPTGEESAIDPIKNWGPGSTAPHTHEFFAQQTISSTISPGALMYGTPGATLDPLGCDGPTHIPATTACTYDDTNLATPATAICDKSAYWVPELIYDTNPFNTVVTAGVTPLAPAFMNIYWRNEYSDPDSISAFPEDLSMIAGNAMATTPQNFWIVNWQCVAPTSIGKWQSPGRYSPTIPPYCDLPETAVCTGMHLVGCSPVYLRMVITFPDCVKLTTNTPQGMVTPTATWYGISTSPTPAAPNYATPGSYKSCPPDITSNHWLEIPNIQVDPHWRLNGHANQDTVVESENFTDQNVPDGQGSTFDCSEGSPCIHFDLSNLLLSSDWVMDQGGTDVTPGTTSHGDYENGYTQIDINNLIADCFHNGVGGMNCGAI